jgi:hypothetical protein
LLCFVQRDSIWTPKLVSAKRLEEANVKRKVWTIVLVMLIVSLLIGAPAGAQEPPLEELIEEAIVEGLRWLDEDAPQPGDGSWGEPWQCDRVARTGLVVLKFATRAIELGQDPLGDEYEYSAQVHSGLDYILANAHTQAIGVEPAGDPDSDGDGIGVYFTDCGHEIYNTGIAMMAIAASGGWSEDPALKEVLRDAVDYMAWAQVDPACGSHRGGWRYGSDVCDSDNSNAGYATLGLGYAAYGKPHGFGLDSPQFVKDELSIWADVIQDDVNGDGEDGGSHYTPFGGWVNILKTGNLIYEMGLVGDTKEVQRVQDAIDYIERHWDDAGGCGTGWQDHRQAMFTMMKGFESLGIELIDLDDDGESEHDWFEEVARHLIETQQDDGRWLGDCWGGETLSTAWALLTLEKAVERFEIEIPVDIKPQSCPNPFQVKKKGVLPVAILGTEEFDVGEVDPASVRLVNLVDPGNSDLHVAPLRWSIEDVATPYEPFTGKQGAYDCNEFGSDGYSDLTLKFEAQEVVAVLGEVHDGDVLVLQLIGNLQEEFGSTPIIGEDVIRILKKAK